MDAAARLTPPDASLRALLRLAWPLFIANLAVVGNGTIDAVMAGRLSPEDMAGVAVASSIYITVYIGFMAVLQALSPIAGHHYGAQRWRAIGDGLQQALWLAGFLLSFALPCVLATGFWTRVAGIEGRVAEITSTYLQAVAFGLPAGLATRVFVALNAAVSRPKVTMVVNVTVLALKAPTNAVFMYGWGPIEAMGGAGAGVATALLAWLALALSLAVWRFDRYYERFRSASVHGPRWTSQRELLKLGIPIGLSTLFEVTSFTFMAVLIARLGATSVAGHQIVANLVAILFMVPLSLGIATSVLVAQALGSNAPGVAHGAAGRGLRLALGIALIVALLFWLLRGPVVRLYTSDPGVEAMALSLIGFAVLFHVFDAVQGMSTFVLRGYRQTFWPMVIYGVALWGFGLGGGAWTALNVTPLGPPRGAAGFWEAATAALAIAAAALAWLVRAEAKRRLAER
ncbi:MAG: MATE family efflux transporter [Betaproteobacteria bacterium]